LGFSSSSSAVVPAILLVAFAACTALDGGVSPPVPANAAVQSWNESPPRFADPKKSSSLRVIIGGDLLPHRPMLSSPIQIATALAPLRPLFASADAVVANYETATGEVSDADDRRLVYGVEPAWMDAVAGSGVTAVTLANNHACDLGRVGLEASIRSAAGSMIALGAGNDDPWRARTIAEKNGHRVCVVAWTTFLNNARSSCEKSGEVALAPLDRKGTARAVSAIADARAGGCDATIAIFHGGIEYEPQVSRVRAEAVAIAEAGADAVVIHHPHVPSPVRTLVTSDGRHVPIFESIGNLVSNQGESWVSNLPPTQNDPRIVYLNGTTRAGVLAEMDFEFSAGGRAEMSWGYHMIWNDNDHVSDKTNKTPLIEARLLSEADDPRLVADLSRDKALHELLSGPCWIEKNGTNCL
jgi:poly-gamma-glutamate capsule biosynthesis protein CapA/YwtB (metallophosphatase superfamily)